MVPSVNEAKFKLVLRYQTPVLSVISLVMLQLFDSLLHKIVHILLFRGASKKCFRWGNIILRRACLPEILFVGKVFLENVNLHLILTDPSLSLLG